MWEIREVFLSWESFKNAEFEHNNFSIPQKTLKMLQILYLNLDTRYTANLLFYDGGIYLEGQLYGSDYPLETLWRVWDTQVYGINCIMIDKTYILQIISHMCKV